MLSEEELEISDVENSATDEFRDSDDKPKKEKKKRRRREIDMVSWRRILR